MRKQTNTLSPSPKGFQSPKISDSDFREVRGLGLGLGRPKSSAKKLPLCANDNRKYKRGISTVTKSRRPLRNFFRNHSTFFNNFITNNHTTCYVITNHATSYAITCYAVTQLFTQSRNCIIAPA
jgi:hypothetical protein